MPFPTPRNLSDPEIRTSSLASPLLYCSVQLLSCVRLFATPWSQHAACQASLSITNSWSLLKFMSIESVMPSNHLILCCPLLLPPSIFPSIRIFSNESVLCIKWPNYCSFRSSIIPSNEYSGPISFRMDWLDLLAIQGTLKSFFQHLSSKASICKTQNSGLRSKEEKLRDPINQPSRCNTQEGLFRLRKRVTLISWEAEHTEQQIGRALYMQKNILSAYYIRVAR